MGRREQTMQRRFEEREPRPSKYRNGPTTKPAKRIHAAMGVYQIVFVRCGGVHRSARVSKAPRTEWMLERGKRYGALFVIRYWPSKKGWRVLDMRKAQSFQFGSTGHTEWMGHRHLKTIFPSEDAAVMAAITLSGA